MVLISENVMKIEIWKGIAKLITNKEIRWIEKQKDDWLIIQNCIKNSNEEELKTSSEEVMPAREMNTHEDLDCGHESKLMSHN